MLKVLEGESAIQKYRRLFIKSFKPFWDEKIQVTLGHPGGAKAAKVFWSDRLGIWMFHEKISGNRCDHVFGVGKPSGTSSIPIACEINFPLHGIDRRMGGALAEDHHGHIFVVHRGKIGGGKKGVGKSLFEKYYRGEWAVMEDGAIESTVAIVGLLNSPHFVRQVVQFIRKVDAMKEVMSRQSSQMEITFDEQRFREEFVGSSYDRFGGGPELSSDHGLIISDLHVALKRKGFSVGNNATIDLFIINAGRRITTVFQAIAESTTASVRTGLSKLLLSGADLPGNPRLILAVPKGMDKSLSEKLKKIGIQSLEFEWQEDHAVFIGLHELIDEK